MRGWRRGVGRVGPNPYFPHWRPTYSLLLPTPSDSVLPVLTPAGPRHLDNAVRYLLNTTAMHSLGNTWVPFGSRASNTQATNPPLQRTASQGCSCRRAREKDWVRQPGRRQRSSISVDSDESRSGYGSTSSSRRTLPSYSCRGPPPLLINPAKETIGPLGIPVTVSDMVFWLHQRWWVAACLTRSTFMNCRSLSSTYRFHDDDFSY